MKIWIEPLEQKDGAYVHTIPPQQRGIGRGWNKWSGHGKVLWTGSVEVIESIVGRLPPYPLLAEVENGRVACVWAPTNQPLPKGWQYVE